ncbi:MAG: hypothetical protein IPJ04_07515 [Candidatus Eisenbacteria bacterium]|nr:hypothetical protein [Candidatus Eisenbacteria bacterium]
MLGDPAWIRDSLHAQTYSYLDRNPNHPTFGDTLFGYVPWDPVSCAGRRPLPRERPAVVRKTPNMRAAARHAADGALGVPDDADTDARA